MHWIIFALALVIRLLYNLHQPVAVLFSCDAFEYLSDAQAMLACIQKSSGVHFLSHLQILHDLTIAGPIFPAFVLCASLLFGQTPAVGHALPLVIAQSLVSAFTVVFIACIAEICWDKKAGYVAGFIAALYPAFIINSGRLYTETFAAFLLSGLLLLICKIITTQPDPSNQRSGLYLCLAAGCTAAALQLTRSSMFGFCLVSLLFVVSYLLCKRAYKQALAATIASLIGFLALAAPWLCFSRMAFGRASLILDRAGRYNFFIGNNIDSWGWLSVPHPDLTCIEQVKSLQLLRCAVHKNIAGWCKLLLDKPHRLFDFPWNDFRLSLGPIDFHTQVLLHQALLLLAVIGIALCLYTRRFNDHVQDKQLLHEQQILCRILVLCAVVFHVIYVFFITVPRYNLTAMPLVIAFAAAGLTQLIRQFANSQMRRTGIYLALLALVLFLIAHLPLQQFTRFDVMCNSPLPAVFLLSIIKAAACMAFFVGLWHAARQVSGSSLERDAASAQSATLTRRATAITIAELALVITVMVAVPARAQGRLFEYQIAVPSGKSLNAVIQLSSSVQKQLQLHNCFLLFDSKGLEPIQHNAIVYVNGKQLAGPFIPGLSLIGNLSGFQAFDRHQIYLECGYIFNCLTGPSNISNVDLRQWFFVPLLQGVVESASKQGSMQIEIKPAGTTPLQIFAQQVVKNQVFMPSFDKCSWEKAFYGVENDSGFSDPRYDLKLSSTGKTGSLVPDVLLLVGGAHNSDVHDSAAPSTAAPTTSASPTLVPTKVEQRVPGNLSISSTSLPPYSKSSFWIVRMTGCVSSTTAALPTVTTTACVMSQLLPSQRPINLSMASAQWANQGRAYGSIKSAQTFMYNPPWTPHHLAVGPKGTSFDIAFPLVPSAMPGKVQSIKLRIGSAQLPLELQCYKIEIYDLSSCPLNHSFHVQIPE